jgi:glutathione synthase/RimK-type ligase-like ATP-grasp enzyme
MGASHIRFDTETFHDDIHVVLALSAQGEFRGRYVFKDGTELAFEDIGVVWNRRIHKPEISRSAQSISYDSNMVEWARNETEWAMNNSFTLIPAPMVNPWEVNERLKFNKMVQMQRAAGIGLAIPDSCVTDDADEMRRFWHSVGHEMIAKKIRQGIIELGDQARKNLAELYKELGVDPDSEYAKELEESSRRLLHTSLITPGMFTDSFIEGLRFCPVFFQRHIPKKYDIRSVVVGERVFSFAIHSQETTHGKIDYRTAIIKHGYHQLKHSAIELGGEIDRKLVAFVKSFGLTFSVIDLVETPDGRIVFLEDNPNGQWAWLELETGVPLSRAFAELLAGMA